ncbi:MAG: hypothetical protein ACKO5E_11715, partial [bacterium]
MNTELSRQWLDFFERHAESLDESENAEFQQQIRQVDWDQVSQLVHEHVLQAGQTEATYDLSEIKPADFVPLPVTLSEKVAWDVAAQSGRKMLGRGEVGVV